MNPNSTATMPLLFGGLLAATLATAAGGCGPMQAHEFTTTAAGAYDTTTRYDFGAASGMLTAHASSAWTSPDVAIAGAIIDTVRRSFGNDAADGVSRYYGASLERDVRSVLAAQAPDWVFDIGSRLGRIDAQLQTVDIQSSWLVTEESDGQYEVTQMWNGIAIFADPTCRQSGSLLCRQTHVAIDTALESEYPLEIISSRAPAHASGRSLVIDAHSVEFNYGRLGLYLLVNELLPDDGTEGVGFRDVALAAVNCRGLAGRLTGSDDVLGWEIAGVRVGLSLDQLIGSCEEGVFGSVNRFVDRFNMPVKMDLSGSAQMIDTDRDGRINRLDNGHVNGALSVVGRSGSGGDVRGEFTAFRVGSL